jgi:hypothetical protein
VEWEGDEDDDDDGYVESNATYISVRGHVTILSCKVQDDHICATISTVHCLHLSRVNFPAHFSLGLALILHKEDTNLNT